MTIRMKAAPVLALVSALGLISAAASAADATYTFKTVASLGEASRCPAGAVFVNDFESKGIQNSGELAFVADLSTGGEGVFITRQGEIRAIACSGQHDPSGRLFGFTGELGHMGFNQSG